ncbi:src homology 2 domain-containing protein sprint isoform 2-T2 [Glossina fuscipes fuscipes]
MDTRNHIIVYLEMLLSSLATDLDMMLNDLRSSPSSRLGATSTASQHHHLHHHQPHHHSQSTATYTPLSLGIGTSSNIAGINRNSQTTQPNYSNYSQSSSTLCDYRSYQQQCEYTYHSRQDIAEKKQQQHQNQYIVDQQQQKQQQQQQQQQNEQQQLNRSVEQVQQNHYELQFNQKICTDANQSNDTNNNNNNGSNGNCELNRINNGNVITTGRLGIQHTQPINALESNINISRSSCCSSPSKSLSTLTSSSSSSSSSFQTFSTDVTRISRLPLYTYQRKQLQQPQTLHIKLLPQQQALKALTSQITAKENVVKHTPSVCAATTTNICNNISSTSFQTITTTTITTALANPSFISSSSSTDFRIKSISASTSSSSLVSLSSPPSKSSNRLYKFRNSGTSNASSWLPSSSNFLRSSDSSVTTLLSQPNQLKSSSNFTNLNNNSNSNNNNSSNNNNNSHQVLPFCGLDSIKGSDNNGEDLNGCSLSVGIGDGSSADGCSGSGSGGKTNSSFNASPNNGNVNASAASRSAGMVSSINPPATTSVIMPHDNASDQFQSLDANDSSCCGDGQFEDDMQALLPKCQRLSRDELSQSRTSLVSSSDGGILAEGETSSETSRGSEDSPPCDLGLVERLLLTHPVWFLPGIQRSGAVHFLQGKEEGNFIVRGSSQPNTMAVSVRLPPDTGPYIEHYLIQSNDGILCLESSRFKFDSIPALIAHYAQCCDELPVQLVLPRALREAKNRQQLSSLALLGQEFWRYPMSCPSKPNEQEANFLDAKSPSSVTDTSGLGTTVFSNSGGNFNNNPQSQSAKVFSPVNNLGGVFSQAGTPSDTTSSMSSFTTSGGQHMQLMSPESVDSVILTMSPVDLNNPRNAIIGLSGNHNDVLNASTNSLSTFKANNSNVTQSSFKNAIDLEKRTQRPKPPNTLNLDLRKPPAPPMRWSKPLSPTSPQPPDQTSLTTSNNFTVTTTVTFSVDNAPQFVEVTTPAANNSLNSVINSNATFQTFSKRLSPEGECKDTLSSQGSSAGSRWQSQSSKDSNNSQHKILSPCSVGTPTSLVGCGGGKSRKSKARKESKHYQESDILESPEIYCRSTLHDKISDYEDLWSHDPSDRAGLLSSFKPPDGQRGKRPDLLAETPTIITRNTDITSSTVTTCPPIQPNVDIHPLDNTSDTQQLLQFSVEPQPRSRAGLILPGLMSQSLSEDQVFKNETTEGDTTPTAQTPVSRSKQGSPFYAEPADALKQAAVTASSILRRSQRGALLPANHRHSEPPKGGFVRNPICPMLVPSEIEKIAGSLDELKKKQQAQQQAQPQQQPSKRIRGRFEQWQLDSSWEFMGKTDENEGNSYGDYDSSDQWKEAPVKDHQSQENDIERDASKENKQKPITVHQIIAKRLPNLNLPELIRCSTPPQQQQKQQPQHSNKLNSDSQGQTTNESQNNGYRLSSYDNVERNYVLNQCLFNGLDSAQSDDGTVFSEPWDSSQWDSFMPHDDTTTTSDSIHLSKCRPVVSEDDTIIEELNTKEIDNQDTLKPKKTCTRHATILRNPSIRDREILCHPRNKINIYSGGPGESLRAYTLQLAQDQYTTFARNIENFIACTKDSREAAPQVVMRNMRQFMNGMKNYLVKHGEGKFHQEVEAARSRLKSDEFLNLDAILETVMHQLVVLPLREHLYGMFVDYYTRSEDIQLLAQNVKYACGRNAADFGIRPSVSPPSPSSLQAISNLLLRLQEAELPLEKLDLFLCVISTIFEATGCPRGQQLGADDFLPVLVYVVAKCGFVGAEIEAEFMWGLLQPTLLNGEPGYYLTALCSAVHVLKSFMASENESGSGSLDWRSSSLPACSSVLRVIIPDECNGSLQTRTLPVRPHTTTREVCRIIAHKARITNPQDYGLFKLVDGEETILNDNECPQDIRLAAKGKHCMLAYKRIDAKIAWPTATQPISN